MKKKLIIGAFVLTSLVALAQKTGDSTDQTESKFWGTQCHQAKSSSMEKSSTVCCYYVFWINTGCKEVG